MKANIQLEFTDDEVKRYATELLVKGFTIAGGYLGRAFDPQSLSILQTILAQAQATMFRPQQPPMPPGWMPPMGRAGPAPIPRVVRLDETGPVHEKCFTIEETRHMEAGWGCCKCATYCSNARTACRHCGHTRCGPIITPPPAPPPPPSSSS